MPTYTQEQLTIEAKLTPEDLEQVRQCRHAHTRLGFAYQVAFVRLLNRFPRQEPFEVQDEILTYVAVQLDLALDEIEAYSRRRMTVSAHQEHIRAYLGVKRFAEAQADLTDGKSAVTAFIFEQACRLEQTPALLAQVKAFLRQHHILEPADGTLERHIQRQRRQARTFIFEKVNGLLDEAHRDGLDQLLTTQGSSYSTLHRLKQTPHRASPSALLRLTKKLDQIAETGVLTLDVSWLNNNFQRSLARRARRSTASRLRELKAGRRYAASPRYSR